MPGNACGGMTTVSGSVGIAALTIHEEIERRLAVESEYPRLKRGGSVGGHELRILEVRRARDEERAVGAGGIIDRHRRRGRRIEEHVHAGAIVRAAVLRAHRDGGEVLHLHVGEDPVARHIVKEILRRDRDELMRTGRRARRSLTGRPWLRAMLASRRLERPAPATKRSPPRPNCSSCSAAPRSPCTAPPAPDTPAACSLRWATNLWQPYKSAATPASGTRNLRAGRAGRIACVIVPAVIVNEAR